MSTAARLDQALRAAGLPVMGVAIGRKDDKTTWRIDFTADATDAQRAAAAKLMSSFDVTAANAEPDSARDVLGEIDALKTQLAGLQNVLVKKSVIRADEIAGPSRRPTAGLE